MNMKYQVWIQATFMKQGPHHQKYAFKPNNNNIQEWKLVLGGEQTLFA